MNRSYVYLASVVSAVLLIIATGDNDYGYYQFLRVAITITSGATVYYFYESEKSGFSYLFGGIALLFNPFFPVFMDKEVWVLFDWLAVIAFGVGSIYVTTIKKEI